ncbi:putative mpv17 pmp22 protein [Botryosphaeria dothidea]|uniref:Mpv17 pmp22 protein n=1 Tax=Botryosphaeria dothidea TaxID=55169 RepID=A0A8H4IN76_9PEZI|nr:putative mpv17 pmp22 protein [Botryosphaeria dothidea]
MAAVLSATSNVLAQLITAQKTDQAFTIDPTPVFKFVLFTVLSTPPNVLWQEFLEDAFPGQKKPPPDAPKTQNDEKPAKDVVKDKAKRTSAGMNWGNVFMKFLLDQTVGGAVNTALFIAGMKALNGAGSEEIKTAVKEGLWPLFVAGTKLWPAVSLISFTMVPVDKRVLFGSTVGVAWGVYLSLVAAQ